MKMRKLLWIQSEKKFVYFVFQYLIPLIIKYYLLPRKKSKLYQFYSFQTFESYPDLKVTSMATLAFSLFLFKYRNRYPFFLRKHYSSQAVPPVLYA